ncbi:MAG: cytochrome P450 [Gemmatimonadetes bacterium]|nr:cytochrome P450 [Gemmatimonadota bacterium]
MILGPTCSIADRIAFLNDTAVFTTGSGLQYGDVYRIPVPGGDVHVVTDPDLAEDILIRHGDCFEKSRIYWRELYRIVGPALGSVEGERWDYLHQLQQPFFTPRNVKRYLPAAQEITTAHLQRLAGETGEGRTVSVLDALSRMNVHVLLHVLFGADEALPYGEIAERIGDGEAIIAWRSKFPWRPATAWLTGANQRARGHKAFFDGIATQLQSARPDGATADAHAEASTLIDALVNVAADDRAPAFPDNVVRNEIIVHLGAGTETHTVAEGWTLYLLWRHPEVLERVRDEVRDVAGSAPVSPEHLDALIYTRQVLRESLRLYPPSYGLVRDCVRPTELRGCRIRPGQTFFISLCGLHRSPRLWDEPERFLPARFAPALAHSIGKYQYMPFGAGKHVCIGQHLAVPCMLLALGQFVQRFEWEFDESDAAFVGLSTMKPAGPFTARLTPRAQVLA